MRKLIYKMYSAKEISVESTAKLLNKLEEIKEKRKY